MTTLERRHLHASPVFAVGVRVVVFTIEDDRLVVALNHPIEELALPGGLLMPGEDLTEAATRALLETTGLEVQGLTQLGAYASPGGDAAMVTIGYWTIVSESPGRAGMASAETSSVAVDEVLEGGVEVHNDYDVIIGDALEQARLALEGTTLATELCGDEFTITELRNVYEIVWGVHLDQGNFQNKVLEVEGFVVPTGERRAGGRGRPPELFTAGSGLIIDPPFRRPRSESPEASPRWEETPKSSMGFRGYVDRVGFHFDRLGVTERPTQQQYIDAWNNQIPAGKLASTFARRVRRQTGD